MTSAVCAGPASMRRTAPASAARYFAWLLPTALGVAAATCWIRWLQLRSVSRSQSAGQRTAILWLAVCTTILALILFALAPVNDLFNLLLCLLAVYFFRKPERNRVGQTVIIGAAFLALVLAPVVFRAANMWLPGEKIILMNQPAAMVGYVLTTDARYATVLMAADPTAQVLSLDDVESRTICRLNPGLESASLVRYIAGSASKRTPSC
jgi:hypothetical protein